MNEPGARPAGSEAEGQSQTGKPPLGSLPPAVTEVRRPTVPDYEVLRKIGGGAYGEVWLARNQATGVLRAAKFVWRHRFEDDRPFQREFEGIQKFERISREHPSQLALFHIGRNEAEGYFYYVMELADAVENPKPEFPGPKPIRKPSSGATPEQGQTRISEGDLPSDSGRDSDLYSPHTLRADLQKGRLGVERALGIGLALTEALGHLHRHGLVHRDVKPSNVIFVNGRPKLADIGLVTGANDSRSIVGTEGYLAWEGPGSPEADIFALGKVLYEAATGLDRLQFPKLPDDLRSWSDARLMFELNEILLRACAHDFQSRYRNCAEMQAELELLDRGESVQRRRRFQQRWAVARRICLVAAVCSLAALAIGAAVAWRERHKTRSLSQNAEAQMFYDQAVYELKSGALDRLKEAYTNLTRAVEKDPGFVDAHYAMLDVYKGLFAEKLPPHTNQLENLRMVAGKLRQLSPRSAQYYTVDSMVKFKEWKFDEAIEEVSRAIKINQALPRAHGIYGWYMLLARGDVETAEREYAAAERLEGSDVTIETVRAGPFYFKRDYPGAIRQSLKAINLEPQAPLPHHNLARAYEAAGNYEQALDEYARFDELCGNDPEKTRARYLKLRTALHGEKGTIGYWEFLLEGALRQNPADAYGLARIYARLGRTNELFSSLSEAREQHSGSLVYLFQDDAWDPYRDDDRFQLLLKTIGLGPPKASFRK